MEQIKNIRPSLGSDRIISLDLLRGFAVLGILVMNIIAFSMHWSAYSNPTVYGDFTGLNQSVWKFSHIFADQKFMGIFSVLFGAGIVLFTGRLEEKGIKSGPLHYRRMMWLIIFGLLHSYLLWHGDILFTYGIIGLLAFLFRKKSVLSLSLLGVLFLIIPSLLFLFSGWSIPQWPQEQIQLMNHQFQPADAEILKNLEIFRGDWVGQFKTRIPVLFQMQIPNLFMFTGWRVLGLMLLGMALYKSGVLSAQMSEFFYLLILALGGISAYLLITRGVELSIASDFNWKYTMFFGSQYNYWGSILMIMAYISLFMLIAKTRFMQGFTNLMASVGRMAFTNYLMQTIICTSIFYGYGFGYYGKMERWELLILVGIIWIFQIAFSYIWLKFYKFGPFEWLWRSLTYRKLQSIKK